METDKMADETKTKRAEKTKRIFLAPDADGNLADIGRNPRVDIQEFTFTDVASGENLKVTQADLFGTEVDVSKIKPAGVLCAWFGLKVNLGNAFGGKNASFEDVLGRLEHILDGEWSEGAGESGPRKTLLAEAIVRVKKEAGEDRTIDEIAAKLAAMDNEQRKALQSDPKVAYHYAVIQDERKKARLKELKKAAGEAETSALADF
jgi:hypothetical protein